MVCRLLLLLLTSKLTLAMNYYLISVKLRYITLHSDTLFATPGRLSEKKRY